MSVDTSLLTSIVSLARNARAAADAADRALAVCRAADPTAVRALSAFERERLEVTDNAAAVLAATVDSLGKAVAAAHPPKPGAGAQVAIRVTSPSGARLGEPGVGSGWLPSGALALVDELTAIAACSAGIASRA